MTASTCIWRLEFRHLGFRISSSGVTQALDRFDLFLAFRVLELELGFESLGIFGLSLDDSGNAYMDSEEWECKALRVL